MKFKQDWIDNTHNRTILIGFFLCILCLLALVGIVLVNGTENCVLPDEDVITKLAAKNITNDGCTFTN